MPAASLRLTRRNAVSCADSAARWHLCLSSDMIMIINLVGVYTDASYMGGGQARCVLHLTLLYIDCLALGSRCDAAAAMAVAGRGLYVGRPIARPFSDCTSVRMSTSAEFNFMSINCQQLNTDLETVH